MLIRRCIRSISKYNDTLEDIDGAWHISNKVVSYMVTQPTCLSSDSLISSVDSTGKLDFVVGETLVHLYNTRRRNGFEGERICIVVDSLERF